MEISAVFHSISLIALLIIIGAIAARYYVFNNDSKQLLITLITNVGMPAIILSSIFNVDIDANKFKTMMIVFIASIIINIFGLSLGYLITHIFKKNSKRKVEVAILSAFGNTGFIGIPLCAVLFGAEGALYAAIFDAGVDFTIWTVGVYLLQKERSFNIRLLKGMINIPIIAILIGLTIAATGLTMPNIIIDLSDMLAAFAVPLAMFFIGAIVSNFQQANMAISYFEIIVPIVLKLIILPLIVIVVLVKTRLSELLIFIIIIQSMMPALTLSSILFAKYSKDDKFGALITIVTTVLSLLIIPGMLWVVDILYQ